MCEIKRYCMSMEDHYGENVFEVCYPNIMGNPFTEVPKSKCKFKNLIKVKDKDEAIKLYEVYFNSMLKINSEFKNEFDRIYSAYLKFDVIYLGCFCKETEVCHSDVIIKKIKQRSVKEILKNLNIKTSIANS